MTRSLAAVFAHPDDETFATGATLSRYASQGVRCSLYCATDGDAGRSSGVPVSSSEELAAIRRAELRAACDILGVSTIVSGGHPDGALQGVDPDLVIGEIVALLRRERPDVVVTFGPEGAPTRHRDHRAICRLATSAFLLAGTATAFPEQIAAGLPPHRPARLAYVTWPAPPAGSAIDTQGQPIHLSVPAAGLHAVKMAAFLAHRTQLDHIAHFRSLAMPPSEDYFVAGGAAAPASATSLFDGL